MSIGYCPHCGESIRDQTYADWYTTGDYSQEFDRDCPACGVALEVEVVPVPEFNFTKKE